jgi:hypothetical protein
LGGKAHGQKPIWNALVMCKADVRQQIKNTKKYQTANSPITQCFFGVPA